MQISFARSIFTSQSVKKINKEVTCDELKFFTESQYINSGINFVEGCGGFNRQLQQCVLIVIL